MNATKAIRASLACAALLASAAGCGSKEKPVGSFSNDLLGNQIKVEAVADPGIPSVVCHMAYFERGFLDRASQGNWFEDPSNSAVTCQRTGPIDLTKISLAGSGEEIFSQKHSLFFKKVSVRRIVDVEHRAILYVSYSREIVKGSAKMSISSVLLTPEEAAAANKAP